MNTEPNKYREEELKKVLEEVRGNEMYLDNSDLEVLKFLAKKGLYEKETVEVVTKTSTPFIDEVEEFNNVMGKEYQNRQTPTINKKDAQFVIDFIQEELDELKEAVENNDIVEILDALVDITYVGLGNGVMSFGLKDKIIAAYEEVQASNLSKVCKTEEEAVQTVMVRSKEQGEECYYRQVQNNYIVYRTRDNKVMKSVNYFRPNLKKFFTETELKNI